MNILKWLDLTQKVVRNNLNIPTLPYKIVFVVTKECHSRCQNCKIWRVTPQNELTTDEIRKLAKNSPFLNWLNLTGGEVTDRTDLTEIVKAFLDACPNLLFVNFATNGLRPEHIESACKKIIELKPPKFVVTVSIDGPTKLNDALRGVKGDFDAAVETYSRLNKLKGVKPYVGMTLYPINANAIDETVSEIAKKIPGFSHKNLHINVAHTSEHYFENDRQTPSTPPAALEAINSFIKKRGIPTEPFGWIEKAYHHGVESYLLNKKTPVKCASIQSSLFISEHGEVYPCSIWGRKLGSLRESNYSLVTILENENTKKVRELVKAKDCPNCWTPCEAYQSIAGSLLR